MVWSLIILILLKKNMKALFTLLLIATSSAAITCHSSLRGEIEELHTASVKAGEAFLPKLEELVQQANIINIQGRALRPEEMKFTSKVLEFQNKFAEWKKDMENIAPERPDDARLEMEQSLNHTIFKLTEQVDKMLTGKN